MGRANGRSMTASIKRRSGNLYRTRTHASSTPKMTSINAATADAPNVSIVTICGIDRRDIRCIGRWDNRAGLVRTSKQQIRRRPRPASTIDTVLCLIVVDEQRSATIDKWSAARLYNRDCIGKAVGHVGECALFILRQHPGPGFDRRKHLSETLVNTDGYRR